MSRALGRKRWDSRFWALLVVVTLFTGSGVVGPGGRAEATGGTAPNIVLILSDDQRWDTLWSMHHVQSEIVDHGVMFTNAFVVNSSCCPSRSTILTGAYSHTTGVYTNHANEPYGGFPAFHDATTIATVLQAGGYRTGLFGKYLNGYKGTYVPPGWDRWFGSWTDGAYYDYDATLDGDHLTFGSKASDYSTDVYGNAAVDFIQKTDRSQPLFLYFAPHAPHNPATPAPGDGTAFSSLPKWRPRSWNEADVSDKPSYVQRQSPLNAGEIDAIDEFRRDQYRTLLDLDREVDAVVSALDSTGRLSNTLLVFASDNGMLWGEHRLTGKDVPYEESIRIPLVVRFDGVVPAPSVNRRMVLNLDLAPTFAAVAGVELPGAEGRSLLPLLSGTTPSWRTDFLIEHLNLKSRGHPTYCAVRERRYIWVDYGTGEKEFYDLSADPYELQNHASSPRYRAARLRLKAELRRLCDPPPPHYTL